MVGKLEIGVAQLVKERHRAAFKRLQAQVWSVAQEAGNEVNGILWCTRPEDLAPRVGLHLRRALVGRGSARELKAGGKSGTHLWELVLRIVLVHALDLVEGGGAQHLDNLDELINTAFTREKRYA